jgi:hypothetical protein
MQLLERYALAAAALALSRPSLGTCASIDGGLSAMEQHRTMSGLNHSRRYPLEIIFVAATSSATVR